jgi:hypothetical protein
VSPTEFKGVRSAKSLGLARDFNRYQRSWFSQVQARAAAGDPIAVVNADAPQEIFRALDIPYVVTQWWSSVVAAKQKAGAYLGHLEALGYPDTRERYTALAFGSSLEEHRDGAPWGGLPGRRSFTPSPAATGWPSCLRLGRSTPGQIST